MKLNEVKKGKSVADLGIKYEGGDFRCIGKELTSLEGAPQEVDGGFYCLRNKLTSLEGAPQEVGGAFDCDNNSVTSLEGAPQKVGSFFSCNRNNLTSLKGAPLEIGGGFYCSHNKLTSLEGAPLKVYGRFDCANNSLTSLDGAPREVGIDFICSDNLLLTSLKDIHKHIRLIGNCFYACNCPIKSHVLGLLLIKNLKQVTLDNKKVEAIINAHLDGGSMRSAMDCQHALIKAGFPEYAKL